MRHIDTQMRWEGSTSRATDSPLTTFRYVVRVGINVEGTAVRAEPQLRGGHLVVRCRAVDW